jgi:sugar (pentulose or hexulose) kinase
MDLDTPYPGAFEDPRSWLAALRSLCRRIPPAEAGRVGAIALAGTSGTLLACGGDGAVLPGPLSLALAYHRSCPEWQALARSLVGDQAEGHPAASASGSLARALHLIDRAGGEEQASSLLLRHQADWVMGWLLRDWRWGEAGNNLRLGWDVIEGRWVGDIARQSWRRALPRIRSCGEPVGDLAAASAEELGLPRNCLVVAGSTDANAGVLAAAPGPGEGITVLGTTLVVKQFTAEPLRAAGLSCHRLEGRWLVGGASNAGAGILRRYFNDGQISELSRQIDPDRPTGLRLRPLPAAGERFPVDDPSRRPVLGPRPTSDALYLQALLEGLTALELECWARLRELGAPPLQRIITLGGGARNPQWRQLRQRALGVPVINRPGLSAALGMARVAARRLMEGEARAPQQTRMASTAPHPP